MPPFYKQNDFFMLDTDPSPRAVVSQPASLQLLERRIRYFYNNEEFSDVVYFALWYLFNIGYNIYNKQALNALDYPWTIAFIQMAAGIAYFVPLWILGLRKAPKLSFDDLKTLFPIALCHTGVHIGAVIALGAGAVSFAHIVKASEPVVTCGMNAAILGEVLPLPVYLTLLPIIGGVAIASMKELSFTVLALASAMLSNVSSAARGVLSKKTMSGKKIGENLDAQNLYAVLTAMSTFILLPLMFAFEGTGFFGAFNAAVKSGEFTKKSLATLLALGGATYYAYNEVAFLALGKVCWSARLVTIVLFEPLMHFFFVHL
jgi:solute carrier family 35 protein E1